ncbi:hypothetical protein D3C81_2022940 [compost metagenome]
MVPGIGRSRKITISAVYNNRLRGCVNCSSVSIEVYRIGRYDRPHGHQCNILRRHGHIERIAGPLMKGIPCFGRDMAWLGNGCTILHTAIGCPSVIHCAAVAVPCYVVTVTGVVHL